MCRGAAPASQLSLAVAAALAASAPGGADAIVYGPTLRSQGYVAHSRGGAEHGTALETAASTAEARDEAVRASASPEATAAAALGRSEAASGKLQKHRFYFSAVVPLGLVTAVLAWLTRPDLGGEAAPPGFRRHQWAYLCVWATAIGADWFQGPYTYAVYAAYGYGSSDVARLFVADFGSSMAFGTVIGVLADAWGRKRCAQLYCVLYIASCLTTHTDVYPVLMAGRIFGGMATSILFSAFECWMVAEHTLKRGFSESLLRYMFSLMYYIQYLAGIVAGLLAQAAADAAPLRPLGGGGGGRLFVGGYTGPFDMAVVSLLVALALISSLWEENYGHQSSCRKGGAWQAMQASLGAAVAAFRSDNRVLLLGVIIAGFEGSMFAFVFNWTPALNMGSGPPPHGVAFSAFMMACMCGASIFVLLPLNIPPAKALLPVLLVSAAALASMAVCLHRYMEHATFLMFLVFEAAVGMYFPATSLLKSQAVPEEARAGVYNVYRIPLNAAVMVLLLTDLPLEESFIGCAVLILVASAALAPMALESHPVRKC